MFFAVDDGLYRDFVGEAVVLSGVIMRTATPTLVASADKIVKSSVCRCLDLEAERKCLNHGQNGAVDHMAGVSPDIAGLAAPWSAARTRASRRRESAGRSPPSQRMPGDSMRFGSGSDRKTA